MRTRKITVVPYDVSWKSAFDAIRLEIEGAVGEYIVGVEHVGSTSVVGMRAKPCIDIDVIIKDYSVFDKVVQGLSLIGYFHEGDLGIKDREAFGYSGKGHLMNHHLYVCPLESEELKRHIAFRDYLRKNPDAIEEYSRIKEVAASRFPDDIDGYIEYKAPFIREVLKNELWNGEK